MRLRKVNIDTMNKYNKFYNSIIFDSSENQLDFPMNYIQYELYYFSNFSYLCSERKKNPVQ